MTRRDEEEEEEEEEEGEEGEENKVCFCIGIICIGFLGFWYGD